MRCVCRVGVGLRASVRVTVGSCEGDLCGVSCGGGVRGPAAAETFFFDLGKILEPEMELKHGATQVLVAVAK